MLHQSWRAEKDSDGIMGGRDTSSSSMPRERRCSQRASSWPHTPSSRLSGTAAISPDTTHPQLQITFVFCTPVRNHGSKT